MLAILKSHTEDFFDRMICEMESRPEEFDIQKIQKAQNTFKDIIKIALPLTIQNIALENVGTSKLKSILEGVIQKESLDNFKKFFSTFLYADLRLPGLKNILHQYAKDAQDKSLLKIIFFKLLYYYQFRYFSSSLDVFLENTLANVNIKLQSKNKFSKGQWIDNLKKLDRSSMT